MNFKKIKITYLPHNNLNIPRDIYELVNDSGLNQEEINILRKTFCKITQTIEFMEPAPENFKVFDIIQLELVRIHLLDFVFDFNTSLYIFYITFIICIFILILQGFKFILTLYESFNFIFHEMVSLD